MMKHCTRFFLPLLLLCLSFIAFALCAGAAVETGSCGENLTYTLDTDTGLLTISGTGPMTEYYANTPAPWSSYAASVRTVVLEEGVTTLGNLALDCTNLERLSLPTTLTEIGTGNLLWESPLWESMPEGEVCVDGWLMGYKGTKPKNLCLSEGIVGMTNGVFALESVETAILPSSLMYVGKDSFFLCDALTDVTILNPDCIFKGDMSAIPFPLSTTLHGYKGSTTEAYASMYGNPFVALQTPVRVAGDADGDGVITVSDALLVLRTLLNGGAADEYTDMNGDGELTLLDIILILKSIKA